MRTKRSVFPIKRTDVDDMLTEGLTERDLAAMFCMAALVQKQGDDVAVEKAAALAYKCADALITESVRPTK